MNLPTSPFSRRNGKYAAMLVIVAYKMAFESFSGPSHAAIDRGCALRELALDRIAGDDRIVHEQPERDDERRNRHLLNVEADELHQSESHRQRDRDRQRHQQSRTPFPESHERDEDHEHDGFPEAAIEQIQLLAHLPLLVGRRADDEIGRERSADLLHAGADCRPEAIDLFAFLHFRRQRDRAASQPAPVLIAPCVIRDKTRRMLVSAMDAADVAEIDRRAVCRLREDGRVDVGERPKFARLLEGQLTSFGVHGPGGQRGVAALQDSSDRGRNDPERRQSILRIARLDLLLDDADPGDARGFRRDLDRLFDPIGKVIQLTVRVFRTGFARQHVDERRRPA